jgi:hypothetical protein
MKKIDPTGIFVCVHPYSYDDDGVPVVYNPGMRLRGNHRAVARHPDLWALESDPDDIERKRRAAEAPGYTTVPTPDISAPRIVNHKLRARRDIELLIDGNRRVIQKGAVLEPNDPVRPLAPDALEPVEVEA